MNPELRHVLSARDFTREFVEGIINSAAAMEKALEEKTALPNHTGRVIATLFFERSTRTRISFENAAHLLGAQVIPCENAKESSSVGKGESYEDTFRVLGGYPLDAIICRSDKSNLGELARFSQVPIISAGDGGGEHPTQALLDLYTIWKEIGRLDELCVLLYGDLQSRPVRSLAIALSSFKRNMSIFVGPEKLQLEKETMDFLFLRRRIEVRTPFVPPVLDLRPKLWEEVDVVYLTRFQDERKVISAEEYAVARRDFFFSSDKLGKMQKHARVLHPLPKRDDEVDPALTPEFDHRIAWFRQAHNGVPVRMALLHWVFTGEFYNPPPW